MNRISKLGFFALFLAIVFVAAACSSSDNNNNPRSAVENLPEQISEPDEIKIMVIRKIGSDDHTAQFLAGAKQEGEALGFTVDTFSANGEAARYHDTLEQALGQGYDGFIISHGDDAATVEQVQKIVDAGIPVVTFDSIPDLQAIEGVTLTAQNDELLAELALQQLVDEQGEEANLVYLWVDGFPPMVRRNNVYQNFLNNYSGLNEVDRFGTASEPSVQTQNAVGAMLTRYGSGEIDAIFATWDAFATGAVRALNEAGRNEIKMYSIDVSNSVLQSMQQEDSPWVAAAAVDPQMVGAVNMRLLAKKIAGEETPQIFEFEPQLITQEQLNASDENVNMVTLSDIVPGWGQSNDFEEDWMRALKESSN